MAILPNASETTIENLSISYVEDRRFCFFFFLFYVTLKSKVFVIELKQLQLKSCRSDS